jgi:glycosyltransferase involved in cell wall biosynthesis
MAEGPKISIVVRALNEGAHIGRLLEGVGHQSFRDYEVILVDSGSNDDTAAIARRHGARVVKIRPEEFSFGRALNFGCAAATGEVLVFASAHVYPTHDDWLERLVAPFADPKVGLVYGGQRGNETTRFSERRIFETWFPARAEADHEHPFCNNANCAIRRELWTQTPYDESLTGLEDLDWARKITERGYKNVYDPLASVIHVHEETPRKVFNRYRREAIALKRIYPDTHMSMAGFVYLLIRNILADAAAAAREGKLLRYFPEIVWFRACQFSGAWVGYREKNASVEKLRRRFYYPDLETTPDLEPTSRRERELTYAKSPSGQSAQ